MAYTDQEILDNAKRMAAAGAAPDMVREYVTKAKAEQGGAAAPMNQPPTAMLPAKQLREIGREASAMGTPQGAFISQNGEMIKSMGVEGAPPAIGQMIGAATGPAAPFAVPVLGAIGGGAGYLANKMRTGDMPTWGGFAASVGAGAIPGEPIVAAGAKAVANQAVKQGAINVGLTGAEYATNAVMDAYAGKEPTADSIPSLAQVGSSFAGGVGGELLSRGVGRAVGAGKKAATLTKTEEAASQRMEIFRDMRKRGFVIPPNYVGKGSEFATGLAGQASLNQAASRQNADLAQALIREDLGLKGSGPIRVRPGNDPVTGKPYRNDIKAYIETQYEPYESVRKLGIDVDALKLARIKASAAYRDRQNPVAYQEYVQQRDLADDLEKAIEVAAQQSGDPKLLERLRASRANIARAYAIDASVDRSSGYVDPSVLGDAINNDVPLSGNARLLGDFYNNFPTAAADPTRVAPPGIKGLTTHLAAVSAAQGNPSGYLASGLQTTVGKQARRYLLSDAAQNRYAAPRMDNNYMANAVQALSFFGPMAAGRDNPFLYKGEDPRKR